MPPKRNLTAEAGLVFEGEKLDEIYLPQQELSDEYELCEYHAGQAIKMYCQQHDAVCCTVCISEEHRY